MTMELRNLKGTCDYAPDEQKVRQEIIKKLQGVFEVYGYQPIETPIVCLFDILASKYAGGSEILKEVFKLRDQGNRQLGLRYDLTIPFARFVGMNPALRLPFKRYEIGKVFRDGPVKTGRSREFVQCDVDVVGVSSMMAEAELISMAVEAFIKLDLNIFISFNNRKLLSGLMQYVGIDPIDSSQVILSLDKLEKIGEDAVKQELSDLGIQTNLINKLFLIMNKTLEELKEFFSSFPMNSLIEQGIKEVDELLTYINALNICNYLRFTPTLARGLEIYTGTVWEVFLEDGSIRSSLGAGGRYDKTIGSFLDNGLEYPAVGMSFGLDVVYQALLQKGVVEQKSPVKVYIIPLDTKHFSLSLAVKLRRNNIKVEIEMGGRRLKKALEYASKQQIPYVMIVGEDELSRGMIKIKDMRRGIEYEVTIEDAATFILEQSGLVSSLS